MKKIVFTQRVEVIESYGERRDCADQHIADFLYACGVLPIPMPNNPELVKTYIEGVRPDGLFFSGGNDLAAYGGNAPERDETERKLIGCSENLGIPLFGICRGMQMITTYYGAKLDKIDGHIRTKHRISGMLSRDSVNSFHGMGVKEVQEPLIELARSDDGVVEAIQHKEYNIAAVMWHPERVAGFSRLDIDMVSRFYDGGKLV